MPAKRRLSASDHVLLEPKEMTVVGLLDFGDASIGDPIWDLAVLTAHHADRLKYVLAGYQPDDKLRTRITQSIGAFQILRHLGAANWLCTHGLDPSLDLRAVLHGIEKLIDDSNLTKTRRSGAVELGENGRLA